VYVLIQTNTIILNSQEFYGESDKTETDQLGRIVNDRHFTRLSKLLDDSKGKVCFCLFVCCWLWNECVVRY
jgi:hypothetical protein